MARRGGPAPRPIPLLVAGPALDTPSPTRLPWHSRKVYLEIKNVSSPHERSLKLRLLRNKLLAKYLYVLYLGQAIKGVNVR